MHTAETQSLSALQPSCRDKSLPSSVRLDFIRKVYAIVLYMMTITTCVASPFVLHPKATQEFMQTHPALPAAASLFFVLLYAFNFVLVCSMFCGSSGLIKAYIGMFRTFPTNYCFLTAVAAAFGVLCGTIAMQYTAASALASFAIATVLMLILTIYAVTTKTDVTGMQMYVLVGVAGLILGSIFVAFFPGPCAQKCLACFGAIVFGFIIVYDTQLIFGGATGQANAIEYSIDMYAFAAYQLYLDYINFMIYILQILGDRR